MSCYLVGVNLFQATPFTAFKIVSVLITTTMSIYLQYNNGVEAETPTKARVLEKSKQVF